MIGPSLSRNETQVQVDAGIWEPALLFLRTVTRVGLAVAVIVWGIGQWRTIHGSSPLDVVPIEMTANGFPWCVLWRKPELLFIRRVKGKDAA